MPPTRVSRRFPSQTQRMHSPSMASGSAEARGGGGVQIQLTVLEGLDQVGNVRRYALPDVQYLRPGADELGQVRVWS